MSLKDELMEIYKISMKNKDTVTKNTIMMVNSSIKQIEVDKRKTLSDEEIIKIIQKQIKEKKSAIIEFAKGSREDLVELTNKEIEILSKYVPQELSDEEINKIISEVVSSMDKEDMNIGKIMKSVIPKVSGRADGSKVTELVKKYIAGA